MNLSVLQQNWSAIQYRFLGSYGDFYARKYPMDYPLLYLNIPNPVLASPGTGNDPMSYLQEIFPPFSYPAQIMLRSSATSVPVTVNGESFDLPIDGIKSLSRMLKNVKEFQYPTNTNLRFYTSFRYVF